MSYIIGLPQIAHAGFKPCCAGAEAARYANGTGRRSLDLHDTSGSGMVGRAVITALTAHNRVSQSGRYAMLDC